MTELKTWEKVKLTEVFEYAEAALGKEVNLRRFRERIKFVIEKLVTTKQGMAPFLFGGSEGDYWPLMPEGD